MTPGNPISSAAAEGDLIDARYYASQWKLMWIKFKDHKLAMAGFGFLVFLYVMAVFAPFLSPYDPWQNSALMYAPLTRIHLFHEGKLVRPFIYGVKVKIDPATYDREIQVDPSRMFPLRFFVTGADYRWLGLISSRTHLFGVDPGGQINLLGTDLLGRARPRWGWPSSASRITWRWFPRLPMKWW